MGARSLARIVLMTALMAGIVGGCSSRDVEKFFYTGGKVAYDSFKLSKQSPN